MWNDLAPTVTRQRLIVEGTIFTPIKPHTMSDYVENITDVLNMTYISAPILHLAEEYGWCAYMHWKESGIHMYSWDYHEPPFFSVDIYTCKSFDPKDAINYTRDFFGRNLINLVWKE